MKRVFVWIGVLGFILVLGTAGISDLETETGRMLMTDMEFYTRALVALAMLIVGTIGTLWQSADGATEPHRGQGGYIINQRKGGYQKMCTMCLDEILQSVARNLGEEYSKVKTQFEQGIQAQDMRGWDMSPVGVGRYIPEYQ